MNHQNIELNFEDYGEFAITNSKDLVAINNLKLIFREIRDYFAGNVTGITRDETIAKNLLNLLFCKIYDEEYNKLNLKFVTFNSQSDQKLKIEIDKIFEKVKLTNPEIFDPSEKIDLSGTSLRWVVGKLQRFSLSLADRDVIGDAFEELIGTGFRGGEGQFFTPRNVVEMIISIIEPKPGEKIIDPACGSGGFLAHTLKYMQKDRSNYQNIFGIEKDAFLVKIANAYLSILKSNSGKVFCENSLEQPSNWSLDSRNQIKLETFDIVITNPPFGAKIPVIGSSLLKQFRLGHIWERVDNHNYEQTNKLHEKQPPQVLFIERCLQLLKPNGRMAIVLPEGIFGNPSDKYIWEYLNQIATVTGVVSLAQETFQPSTHTKTSVLFLKKSLEKDSKIFMAIAKKIGHNKNGKQILKNGKDGLQVLDDDIPDITKNFHKKNLNPADRDLHLGFNVNKSQIHDHIYIPEYYNPEIQKTVRVLKLQKKYSIITIGELIENGILEIKRGNEIGSQNYGSGEIPFVRTSDIVNWEIKIDPIKSVSEEVYEEFRTSQDIRVNDILFVNDGTFLIGRTALVTELDLKIVIQSHLRKIRVNKNSLINPYFLFYLLNSQFIKEQIEAKTFVQATISTIGNRLNEVILPISNDKAFVTKVTKDIKNIFSRKIALRKLGQKIISEQNF